MNKTNRIHLLNCDEKILEWILDGDDTLAKGLNIHVPASWTIKKEQGLK